jgi:hypothetical protein
VKNINKIASRVGKNVEHFALLARNFNSLLVWKLQSCVVLKIVLSKNQQYGLKITQEFSLKVLNCDGQSWKTLKKCNILRIIDNSVRGIEHYKLCDVSYRQYMRSTTPRQDTE